MSTDLESLARRIIEEGFSTGNLAAIDDVVAVDMVEHEATGPDAAPGKEGLKQAIQMLRAAFSDFRFEITHLTVSGDRVWLRLIGTGTHNGPFMGNPPTGRSMSMEIIELMRFADGKLVEHWGVADRAGMAQQLGFGAPENP